MQSSTTSTTKNSKNGSLQLRCSHCNGSFADEEVYVKASGKVFHREHFHCDQCGKRLAGQDYFERGGLNFCVDDYHRFYAPKCRGCKLPITAKYVTAVDANWHNECFRCQRCRLQLDNIKFFRHQDGALCEACYDDVIEIIVQKEKAGYK